MQEGSRPNMSKMAYTDPRWHLQDRMVARDPQAFRELPKDYPRRGTAVWLCPIKHGRYGLGVHTSFISKDTGPKSLCPNHKWIVAAKHNAANTINPLRFITSQPTPALFPP